MDFLNFVLLRALPPLTGVSFLKKVKDPNDEINILVDSLHVTDNVRNVLEYHKEGIVVNERDFDGDFSNHRNYHNFK